MRKRTPPPPHLPHPQPALDPLGRPFVGNADVTDNLHEAVQVALWSVLGEASHAVSVAIAKGVVTLSGPLPAGANETRLLATLGKVPGLSGIENRLRSPVAAPEHDAAAPPITAAQPLLLVRRFCGLDAASVNAAIRQAIAVLDAESLRFGLPQPEQLVLFYRNVQADTLTLEIAMPVAAYPAALDQSELRPALLPQGDIAIAPAGAGLGAVLLARRQLVEAERRAGRSLAGWWWQRLPAGSFRPWRELPASELCSLRES